MTNWNYRKTKSIREEKILSNLCKEMQLAKIKIIEKEKIEKEDAISIRLWVLLLILIMLIALFYFLVYF